MFSTGNIQPHASPRMIGLAAWSGAGKTTLLARLIPALRGRGLTVSTVKHAHHRFDIDQPGKDSWVHRQAGAREVLIASGVRWALMHELNGEVEPSLPALLAHMSPVDLVLVEGFKQEAHPKIEVHRAANGKPLLYPDDPTIAAIVTDAVLPGLSIPCFGLDDIAGIAEAVLTYARPVAEVAWADQGFGSAC